MTDDKQNKQESPVVFAGSIFYKRLMDSFQNVQVCYAKGDLYTAAVLLSQTASWTAPFMSPNERENLPKEGRDIIRRISKSLDVINNRMRNGHQGESFNILMLLLHDYESRLCYAIRAILLRVMTEKEQKIGEGMFQ